MSTEAAPALALELSDLSSVIPDPYLVVDRSGSVVSSGRWGAPVALGAPLHDLCRNPGRAKALLNRALRTSQPIPGRLAFVDGTDGQLGRVELCRLSARHDALVLVRRLQVDRFAELNTRLDDLRREVARRRQAERALAEQLASEGDARRSISEMHRRGELLRQMATRLATTSDHADAADAVASTVVPLVAAASCEVRASTGVDGCESALARCGLDANEIDANETAVITVPLATHGSGHPGGSLVITFFEPLVDEAATRALLDFVATEASQAMERLALFATEQASRKQATRLLRLVRALALSATADDVVDAVGRLAPHVAGCRFANVALVEPDGRSAKVSIPASLGSAMAKAWSTIPLDGTTPLGDAIHRDEPVLVADHEARLELYPALVEPSREAGVVASASFPLAVGDEVRGAVGFAWDSTQPFDAEQLELLGTITTISAQALHRAALHDHDAEFAQAFQTVLLPPHHKPQPWFEVASDYRAYGGARAGGDWYDLIELDGGSVLLAVGDVVGHGVLAARTMAKLRFALRAVCGSTLEPAEMLTELNRLLARERQEEMATCALVRIDPATSQAVLALAGHPPPVIVVSGSAHLAVTQPGPPLGTDPAWRYHQGPIEVPRGSSVLLYTDGLVERRGVPIDTSLERLRQEIQRVAGSGMPLTDLVDSLQVGTEDDVAALLFRRVP